MARRWILRVLLVYSLLLAFLFALALPRPGLAPTQETLLQASLLAASAACLAALLLLARRPVVAWRIVGGLGLYGALLLVLVGWRLLSRLQGSGPQRLGALLYLSLHLALITAGVCSLGRRRGSSPDPAAPAGSG